MSLEKGDGRGELQKPQFITIEFIHTQLDFVYDETKSQQMPAFFGLSPNFINLALQMEEEPFNPDYVEVDRVLEVSLCEDKDTGEVNIS